MYTTLIQPGELNDLLPTNCVVVDCRFSLFDKEKGRRDFTKSHIPGAVYAHLDNDLSGTIIPGETGRHPLPDISVFTQMLSDWGIDSETQVVAYDNRSGAIAARLWWMLKWLGHDRVAVLDGGWKEWENSGLPTESQVQPRSPKTFIPKVREQLVKNIADVEQMLAEEGKIIVDSRAAKRYAGIEEPIDPVAGHIPGAISLPFMENVGPDGKLLPAELLAARFQDALSDTPSEQVVFYCGSGVTACHNLLAYQHAGLGEALLYPGSWSDWITKHH